MPGKNTKATSHGVSVVCRIRPLSSKEKKQKDINIVMHDKTTVGITIPDEINLKGPRTPQFSFDHISGEDESQEELYRSCPAKTFVSDFYEGLNCTVFAYGQTGSGKTHTMMGVFGSQKQMGLIPRLVDDVFEFQNQRKKGPKKIEIKVAYVEIYLEKIRDLREPTSTNLKVRQEANGGVRLEDVMEEYVHNTGDVMNIVDRGTKNRMTASTKMNQTSSRSHAVFILTLEQTDNSTGIRLVSKMTLIDLAGSETVKKTEAEGDRLKEAQQINKSLSALGNVIKALTGPKGTHCPYRDSKLTQLLADSLGGNSKTCLVVAISPAISNWDSTLSTLRFGKRAKTIVNKVKANLDLNSVWAHERKMKADAEQAKIDAIFAEKERKKREAEHKERNLQIAREVEGNIRVHSFVIYPKTDDSDEKDKNNVWFLGEVVGIDTDTGKLQVHRWECKKRQKRKAVSRAPHLLVFLPMWQNPSRLLLTQRKPRRGDYVPVVQAMDTQGLYACDFFLVKNRIPPVVFATNDVPEPQVGKDWKRVKNIMKIVEVNGNDNANNVSENTPILPFIKS